LLKEIQQREKNKDYMQEPVQVKQEPESSEDEPKPLLQDLRHCKACGTPRATSDKAFASTCGAACTTCCSLMQTKGLPNVALLLQGDGHQKAGRLSFRTNS